MHNLDKTCKRFRKKILNGPSKYKFAVQNQILNDVHLSYPIKALISVVAAVSASEGRVPRV